MRVLVTGATGFVGSRLIPHLLQQGYEVTAAMRSGKSAQEHEWSRSVTIVEMDATNSQDVAAALQGIEVAYYLLHSMSGNDFESKDREMAQSFAQSAAKAGVKRIVYLGGLVPDGENLSPHLASRLEVENALQEAQGVTVIAIRAGILIGGGSTSFELIRRLVERMPVIPLPRFMNANIAPISISDALTVLVASASEPQQSTVINAVGDDVMTYATLVKTYAKVAGVKRLFVPVPSVPYALVSTPAAWISRVPKPVVTALVPSMGEELVAQADIAWDLIPSLHTNQPIPIAQAMKRSLRSHKGEKKARDDHDLLLSDPEWAGGDVVVQAGKTRKVGSSLWSKIAGTHRESS